ncbi:hypothetical protein ABPG74_009201 [Tetrahymena malaccensis]
MEKSNEAALDPHYLQQKLLTQIGSMNNMQRSLGEKSGRIKFNEQNKLQIYQASIQQGGSHLTDQVPYYKSTHSQYLQKVQNQQKLSIKILTFLKSKTAYILLSLSYNGLAVLLFIVNSYLIASEINVAPLYRIILKSILLTCFTLEYLEHLFNSSNKLQEFQKFTMMLDLTTIVILSHDLYGNLMKKNNLLEDKFVWALLCLKFLKVKTLIQQLVFKTHIQPNPDKMPKILPQHEQLKQAIFATVINIFALCLINTSVILFVDEASGGELIQPFHNHNLKFHNALYFQIITMTTIGYGDVTPIQTSGRIITTIFILICAVLFTKWLGKILSLVAKQDKTESLLKNKSFDNIVIIGNIFQSSNHIEKFLKNHYSKIYAEKKSKFNKKIVIVSTTPPKHDPNSYIKFESLKISYKIHKIKYIIVQSLENNLQWIKKAGLSTASCLMCFNYEDKESDAQNSERNMIFSLSLIKKQFPDLKIYVYFTTDLILNETKLLDSSKNFIQRINCRKKYMNYCLTQSIENDGVGSLLQMLLFNKDKINQFSLNFFEGLAEDQDIQPAIKHTLIDYFQGSKNQFYCYPFPPFLIGESFVNVAKFLYLFQYTNAQSNEQNQNNHTGQNEIRIILLGVKSKQSKKVYPNPGHYRIKEGDKGLFIAQNEASVNFFKNLTVQAKQFFDQNFEQPSLQITVANEILNEMIQAQITQARSTDVDQDTTYVNLYDNPRILNLSNHVILAGVTEEDIIDIYYNIRKANQNRVLVFIQEEPFHSMPTRLKDQRNLFFVQCSLKEEQHLSMLNIQSSEKVVIRLTADLTSLDDIKLFKFYRLVQEFYPSQNILLTLNDEKYLDILDRRPFQQKLTWMYWPQITSGNVILEPILFHSMNTLIYYEKSVSSLIMQIASISVRSYQNNQEQSSNLSAINENIANKQFEPYQSAMPSQSFLGGSEKYKGGLYTFTITKRCAKEIKHFGDLQFHFLNRKKPFIALCILKKAQKIQKPSLQQMYDFHQEDEENISEKDNQKQKLGQVDDHINFEYQNKKIKGHLLQEQVDILRLNTDSLLLNPPPFYTQLNEGDKVIALGVIDGLEDRNINLNANQEEEQKDQKEIIQTNQQPQQELKICKKITEEYTPELFQQQLALTQDLINVYQSYNQMLNTISNC